MGKLSIREHRYGLHSGKFSLYLGEAHYAGPFADRDAAERASTYYDTSPTGHAIDSYVDGPLAGEPVVIAPRAVTPNDLRSAKERARDRDAAKAAKRTIVRGRTQADRDAAAATDHLPAAAIRLRRSQETERLDRVADWLRNESTAADIDGFGDFAKVLDGFRRETIRFRDRRR